DGLRAERRRRQRIEERLRGEPGERALHDLFVRRVVGEPLGDERARARAALVRQAQVTLDLYVFERLDCLVRRVRGHLVVTQRGGVRAPAAKKSSGLQLEVAVQAEQPF